MFELKEESVIKAMRPNFGYGGFGDIVYYRTYSRRKSDDTQEHWADTVLRTINGTFSIRKQHHQIHGLPWDEGFMQEYALAAAVSLFRLEWSPPGRGLWCMGTKLVNERGAMPLYNCAYTDLGDNWISDLSWLMDLLMNGVGVGFNASPAMLNVEKISQGAGVYAVGDSREGWVDSVRHLFECYALGVSYPRFDYSYIRPEGEPLETFGGTASGPGPLMELHERIHMILRAYIQGHRNPVQTKTDLANVIGCCVVAGNVRRSAELALGSPFDQTFMNLKDYDKHPERAEYGWMSNNSVILENPEDYDQLGEIAYRVVKNGEPGYFNRRNVKYARMGDTSYGVDHATGLNPCAEIPLENKEVCNLSITCPTRCPDSERWLNATSYATFYSSTVALLPTHQKVTNQKIAKNRRIGVDILDFIGWKDQIGTHEMIKCLRMGYKNVRQVNATLAETAGVPISNRVTTMKPNGTVSKIVGRPPSHPNAKYMLRRIRVQKGTPIDQILQDANIPWEPCVSQPKYTNIFEYPVFNGDVREVHEVSVWEQAANLVLLQREWADNAVSNTLYFGEDEEDDVEHVLSSIVPVTKSVSMGPKDMGKAYAQAPEERITKQEFDRRKEEIKQIDWSSFRGDGMDEKYCTSEGCEV